MKLLFKIIGFISIVLAMSVPLYAHNGLHQMSVFETITHFFTSPVHFGIFAIVFALILVLVVFRSKT